MIEVDGPIHDSTREYDQERDRYLEGLGLTVLRFKNDQVMTTIDNVYSSIMAIVEQPK